MVDVVKDLSPAGAAYVPAEVHRNPSRMLPLDAASHEPDPPRDGDLRRGDQERRFRSGHHGGRLRLRKGHL
ncbi:hypothetical protein NQ318_004073 [Aromia moschata]|uniref:Uncharacterized protein n=1 Tax=Aromia moschata TaxID=1265417 RepID=A0AAV8Z7X2_9CUCU|nr:hypothetical protein NQ318_004073 [Aromia moschata]